jgi:hypothetical protein
MGHGIHTLSCPQGGLASGSRECAADDKLKRNPPSTNDKEAGHAAACHRALPVIGAHSPDPLARTRELTRPSRYLVCSCRVADIKQLFDHPISAGKQRRRNVYSEYLGCLELMISSSPAGCSMKQIGGVRDAPFRTGRGERLVFPQ